MPAVAKSSRELSPLDEETQAKKIMEASVPQSMSDDISSTVVPIGMRILTSRTSAGETKIREDEDKMATTGTHCFHFKSGELSSDDFQVFPKVIPNLEVQLLSLSEEGFPMCVEVKGCQQGKEMMCNRREKDAVKDTSLLIEQWTIQTLPKRSAGNVVTTSMQFLGQAVQSFLHFSQISSWTVSHGGSLPFDLAYRCGSFFSKSDNDLWYNELHNLSRLGAMHERKK